MGNIQNQSSAGQTYTSYEDMQVSREDYGAIAAFGFRWEFARQLGFMQKPSGVWFEKHQ